MAYPLDDYTLQRMAEQQMKEYLREIEISNLLDEVRPRRRSWGSRQACRVLRGLGHVLTSLGQRLENWDRREAKPTREPDAIWAASLNR